ncbi:MAG TPA: rhodanese-like domain-containing protein, partial [Chthonomonadales bacterium]|nr:rhodanese-like domain-containing protein [Chthonomonadales bacterium]
MRSVGEEAAIKREEEATRETVRKMTLLRRRHIVSPGWLARRLENNPGAMRIIDLRGRVHTVEVEQGVQQATYSGCRDDYAAGHIPGALYLDWTTDIVDPQASAPVQVASDQRFKEVMEACGISDDTMVVAYDSHPASQFAARLWWALRYYGHDRARVLAGGFPAWLRAGYPTTSEVLQVTRGSFTPVRRPEWRLEAAEVQRAIGAPGVRIVDARDADQFSGRVRRGSRGGRIPGAISLPRELLYNEAGDLLPAGKLAETAARLGLAADQRIVAYCNGGVAATSVLFALSTL